MVEKERKKDLAFKKLDKLGHGLSIIGLIGILGLFASIGCWIWIGLYFGIKVLLTSFLCLVFRKFGNIVIENVRNDINNC